MSGPGRLLRRQLKLRPPRSADLAGAAGLLAVAVFFFRGAVLGGQALYRRDISMVWYPQVEAFVRCVASGSWPLWDPYRGFGQPLLADPRAEILYPPTWLNLLIPPWIYYTLFVVAHLVFSGIGLQKLSRRWGTSALGAFVAAVIWTAGGPLLSLASMWHHLAGAAWIPWIFLAAEVALQGRSLVSILPLACALAAQVLAGSPDYTILTGLALGASILVCHVDWHEPRGVRNRVIALRAGLGAVLGLALSAGQWLPALEMARRSERWAQSYEGATTWSLHPASLLETVLPVRFVDLPLLPELSAAILEGREPWLHSVYLGIPALGLAAAAFADGFSRRKGYLLGLAVVATLFSLGRHSGVYALSTSLLPALGMLRFPVKALTLAGFAAALLAGLGVDVWLRASGHTAGRWLARVLLPVAMLCAIALAAWSAIAFGSARWDSLFFFHDPRWPPLREVLAPSAASLGRAVAIAGTLLALALARGRLRPAWLAAGLVALVCGDLLVTHRLLHPVAPLDLFRARPQVIRLLDGTESQRLYVYDYSVMTPLQRQRDPDAASSYRLARVPAGWPPGPALVLGVYEYLNPPTAARWGLFGSYDLDILGFYPRPLARLVELLRAKEDTPAHLRLLRLGAVANVLALRPAKWWNDLVPVTTLPGLFEEPIRVFRVPDPFPRAYVVGQALLADGDEALAAALSDPAFDPRRSVLLATGHALTPVAPFAGSAHILERRADRVVVDAELSGPGYLVLVDAYDPGWRARVDGREVPLLRANLAFRAAQVPEGRHRVEFLFRPRSVVFGLAVSAAGIAAALGLAVRQRADASP